MSDIFDIRLEKRGGFGIFRNEILIIFNLDSSDVASFVREQKTFAVRAPEAATADFSKVDPAAEYRQAFRAGPGRELILGPHVGIFRDMLRQNPQTTARQVEKRLRSLGIRFSSITAVTNLARKHGLKLAA